MTFDPRTFRPLRPAAPTGHILHALACHPALDHSSQSGRYEFWPFAWEILSGRVAAERLDPDKLLTELLTFATTRRALDAHPEISEGSAHFWCRHSNTSHSSWLALECAENEV
jgi:hypothetical protein